MCLFKSPRRFLGHVSLRDLKTGHIYRGHMSSACRFEVHFQTACLLGSLGFWSPINRGSSYPLGYFLSILALELPFFCLLHSCHCNLSRCSSSVVFSTVLRLTSGGVFFATGHFSLTLVSFLPFIVLIFCLLFVFTIVMGFVEFWVQNGHHRVHTLGFWYVGEGDCFFKEMIGSILSFSYFPFYFSPIDTLSGQFKHFGL